MDLKSQIDNLCSQAKTNANGLLECPLCGEPFKRLKTHLNYCFPKRENKSPQGKVVQKQSSALSTGKCRISSAQVKTEPIDVTHCMSSSNDLSEKIEYYFAKAKDVDSWRKQCPNCFNPCQINGLKNHLQTCLKTMIPVLKAVSHKEETMREVIQNSNPVITRAVSQIVNLNAFEAELADRLDGARLLRPDVQLKSKVMNDLLEDLLIYINNCCKEVKWKKIPSGSYYEKLKITSLDEIDCMVVCRVDPSQIEYMDGEKLFVKIKSVNSTSSAIFNDFNIINKYGYISPKLFSNIFSIIVEQFLMDAGIKSRGILMEKNDPLSPAITLKSREKKGSLYIDIVPGIEIVGWPKVCANWKIPANLRTSDVKSKFHLVTKIHHSEISRTADDCQMWRLSFSSAEKSIMLPLDDYEYGTKVTCRKDVLRLIKCDLAEVKSKLKGGFVHISSYMLKTVILHLTKFHHKQKLWLGSEIRDRYVEALLVFKHCLKTRFVEHYFVEHANLMKEFEDETDRERSEVEAVIKFINKKFHF